MCCAPVTGMEPTDNPEEADVILFNTCSIREKAEEKVFSDLGRVRPLKLANPDLLIGVGGCVASQEGAAILKRAPYVDVVFGPQTLHRLPQLLQARRATGRSQVDISFPEIEKFDHLPAPQTDVRLGLCVHHGRLQQILHVLRRALYARRGGVAPAGRCAARCAELVAQGVKEVTLLGQNVNAYRGLSDDGDTVDFAFLLQAIAALDGIDRIALSRLRTPGT